MKLINNKTQLPLRVPLGRGRVLHLGPRQRGELSNESADLPGVRALIESGKIEILDETGGGHKSGVSRSAPRQSTQGHQPSTGISSKGDR